MYRPCTTCSQRKHTRYLENRMELCEEGSHTTVVVAVAVVSLGLCLWNAPRMLPTLPILPPVPRHSWTSGGTISSKQVMSTIRMRSTPVVLMSSPVINWPAVREQLWQPARLAAKLQSLPSVDENANSSVFWWYDEQRQMSAELGLTARHTHPLRHNMHPRDFFLPTRGAPHRQVGGEMWPLELLFLRISQLDAASPCAITSCGCSLHLLLAHTAGSC